MRGIEGTASQLKYHLVFLGDSLRWEPKACDKVDGVLIVGAEQLAPIVRHLPPSLPRVAMLIGADTVSSVQADDYQGAALGVRYLLERKHRRIACLMEKKPVLARRRLAGYRDALSEADIEPEPGWIRLTPSANADKAEQPYLEWGRRQMLSWLAEGWSETGCTAIFTQNETAAIGVMQVLQEQGIRVPQDVSVMGFDGTEICDLASPRLCAVELPLTQIGTTAIEMLYRQIRHGREDVQAVLLPARIREGASVAPCREYS
jgi:DNA-binding LacI/PurR family transcriptional regulator